ncbi:flavin oxidoreductase [Marinomonas rhizomae]|uniref:Flavin reductase (DIM6/NTAB) family NADH-FMN oxidoreductase RutF n=1 Tax=Marinomonas rhizomae TaxID=491948 RepID=A0A366J298_9GAMM|nr:flavin reductase [Marinomonas rhizomae]RBP80480.1 flavin reductase (DIM6/NTAB) family NADH-FMN oxidoreductase RutF [Marinomonas rhizomae]RNF71717.1 flavin oxidoreductase [Marinomonas rhizomae]
MNFDPKEFRRALGNFATGVTVVTAQDPEGNKVGVTANSFNSVSLDPPLVLWSLVKSSSSYETFEKSAHFAVNILAADQIDLSNNFAKPSDDKFAGIEYTLGVGNSPILKDTTANFQCETHQVIDGGDHWIMIGKVLAFEHLGSNPLLYVQGSYAGAIPFTGLTATSQNTTPTDTLQRLNNNAFYLMNKVLQKIQENYLPKQASIGLNTSEARLLLVLSDTQDININTLKDLVTIPETDVESGVERLTQTGLITDALTLTAKGQDMAARLWDIANQQQDDIFGDFSEKEYDNFKQLMQSVLKQLN